MPKILIIDDDYALSSRERKKFCKDKLKDISDQCVQTIGSVDAHEEKLMTLRAENLLTPQQEEEDTNDVAIHAIFLHAMKMETVDRENDKYRCSLKNSLDLEKYAQNLKRFIEHERIWILYIDAQFITSEVYYDIEGGILRTNNFSKLEMNRATGDEEEKKRRSYGLAIIEALIAVGLQKKVRIVYMSNVKESISRGVLIENFPQNNEEIEICYKRDFTFAKLQQHLSNSVIVNNSLIWSEDIKNVKLQAVKKTLRMRLDDTCFDAQFDWSKHPKNALLGFLYNLRKAEEENGTDIQKAINGQLKPILDENGDFWSQQATNEYLSCIIELYIKKYPDDDDIEKEPFEATTKEVKINNNNEVKKLGLGEILKLLDKYEFSDENYSEWAGRIIEVIDIFCTLVLKMVKSTQLRNPKNDKKSKVNSFDKVRMIAELGGDTLSEIVHQRKGEEGSNRDRLLDKLSFKQTGEKEEAMFTIPISYFPKLEKLLKNK